MKNDKPNAISMKSYNAVTISMIIFFISLIINLGCVIAILIFNIQNPDMTAMRRFIEYPAPTIIAYTSIFIGYIQFIIVTKVVSKRKKK